MNIVHVVGRLGRGGDSTIIFNVLDMIDTSKYKFDFITHVGCDENCVKKLRKKGCKVFILDGDVRKLGPFKYYKEIRKILKENPKYDVMHIHTSVQSGIAMLAAKNSGIAKRVCHAHTNEIQRKTSYLKKIILSPILKLLIKLTVTDKVACGKMAGEFLFGKKSKFNILRNGIDINFFKNVSEEEVLSLKKEFNIKDGSTIVGHIGRFSDMKNQEFILELARNINENVTFIFVGEGENMKYLQNKANSINRDIIFTGRRKDVNVFMHLFDVLLLPSLKGEGFPITLVEAQASGCKCLVSTNVTEESDLGLNKVKFLDLDDIDIWINNIKNICSKKYIVKEHELENDCEKIKAMKFEKSQSYLEWIKVYEGI